MYKEFTDNLSQALTEVLDIINLPAGSVFVIGCSTSEILGERIGSSTNEDLGVALFETARSVLESRNLVLAAQCCEHLNRALVLPRAEAVARGFELVNVVPVIRAGGAFATAAFSRMANPAVVEFIRADAGLDIGDTLIGMHIKHVAVPIRIGVKKIGRANLVAAATRHKYIGGSRAHYTDEFKK